MLQCCCGNFPAISLSSDVQRCVAVLQHPRHAHGTVTEKSLVKRTRKEVN